MQQIFSSSSSSFPGLLTAYSSGNRPIRALHTYIPLLSHCEHLLHILLLQILWFQQLQIHMLLSQLMFKHPSHVWPWWDGLALMLLPVCDCCSVVAIQVHTYGSPPLSVSLSLLLLPHTNTLPTPLPPLLTVTQSLSQGLVPQHHLYTILYTRFLLLLFSSRISSSSSCSSFHHHYRGHSTPTYAARLSSRPNARPGTSSSSSTASCVLYGTSWSSCCSLRLPNEQQRRPPRREHCLTYSRTLVLVHCFAGLAREGASG